jgi:AcrR family transcriptional regulator
METKETKIIGAAQKLFFRHGLKKVSMSDIAEAAGLSRPSLYSVFANKEAVIGGLLKIHIELNHEETMKRLPSQKSLRGQLECLFKIWMIDPFASAIDTDGGKEMMETISDYAPEEFAVVYSDFEKYLVELLKSEMGESAEMSAKDLAHILTMATKGLKASSKSVDELQRLTDGLVTMTLKVVNS